MPSLPQTFDPAFPPAAIAALAGVAIVFAVGRALTGRRLSPSWLGVPVLLLRIGAIGLIALWLLNPSRTDPRPLSSGHSAVLVDASASMTLGAPGAARWTEATAWVQAMSAAVVRRGLEAPQVRVFAGDSRTVAAADLAAQVPGGRETRLAAALEALLRQPGSTPLEHVVVVSDGVVHDRERLTAALSAVRGQGATVGTHVVGTETPPRNAAIASVLPPRMVRPRTKVTVPVDVETTGIAPNETLRLRLTDADGAEMAALDFQMPAMDGEPTRAAHVEKRLTFEVGAATGHYALELSGPDGEVTADDNRFAFSIEVVGSKLRVLMVEGTHVKRSVGTNGHWLNDIELMTRAWDATGEIEWEVLTPLSEYVDRPNLVSVKEFVNAEMRLDKTKGFPKTRADIFKYDVMFISDVPVGNFSDEQMRNVVDWVVERGGGFLMGGGYTSFDSGNYDETPWEKIIPVDMLAYGDGFFEDGAHPFKILVPASARNHPIWQMSRDPEENARIVEAHPPFTGMNRVRRAKPGATLLAVRPETDNEPVFAVQSYGRGRSIAYLPDPNGGWARYLVGWGPPGGPVQGPHTEMGHGANFIFNEAAAQAAQGPSPPHPSPWYGQFWVNVVKWLGENSVRWRRDKLSGKILQAQARPGGEIGVAAEVFAVTESGELPGLDVGARLDVPGSPRVRLNYDRDRREFTGTLRVPAEASGGEVRALFDTVAAREPLTDSVAVGLRQSNREFSTAAPDRALMKEVAAAGGGSVLESPEEAAEACLAAAKARAEQSDGIRRVPLWSTWPWWSALVVVLSLEWALRRWSGARSASQTPPLPVTA